MLKIRIVLAKIFKFLFELNFVKDKYFGLYKRVFKPFNLFKGVVVKGSFNGLTLMLHIDDWIQSQLYFLGEYEMAELKTLNAFLNDKSVFVDLGANLGLFSLYASQLVGEKGQVISFEPFKKNYEALSDNVSINNLLNIQIENLAIGEKDSFVNLYYDSNEMNLGMVSTSYIDNAYVEKINVITLDSYFEQNSISRLDFIKIDIEGHEYKALLGMNDILIRFHPTILIEILNNADVSINKKNIYNYLENLGYKKYFINNEGGVSKVQTDSKRQNYIFTTKINL
ncbi:MAG: hypothetical protein COB73_08790 [Flavobacteriaceae bacterium]|nr:MAG: hypothetical protein COB73_08790 [Flavobacteriaceae bacterium]